MPPASKGELDTRGQAGALDDKGRRLANVVPRRESLRSTEFFGELAPERRGLDCDDVRTSAGANKRMA